MTSSLDGPWLNSQASGTGVLAILHDIAEEHRDEYLRWHTREHIPERVAVSGFMVGSRYVSTTDSRYRYLAVYEADDASAFESLEYLQRLNDPTPWTSLVQPHFTSFARSAGPVVAARGADLGDWLAIAALELAPSAVRRDVEDVVNRLHNLPGSSSVRAVISRDAVTSQTTAETRLRGGDGSPDVGSAFLLVGAVDAPSAKSCLERVRAVAGPGVVDEHKSGVYRLDYRLSRPQRCT